MSAFDELVGDLRGGGVVDSKGRFTLDPEKAREKMRRFLLADPRRYVLELVQAAVLRGATAIDFKIDANDMWMRFDGRPFRADELGNLYGSIFADGDGSDDLQAVRQLALGINAAMGMAPKHARIVSGDVTMELRVDGSDTIEESRTSSSETVIHVRQRARPRVVLDFFRNLIGLLGEQRHIRERCAYASVPITLDGKTIAESPRALPEALVSVAIAGDGFVGVAGYCPGLSPELRLCKDGVWISSSPLKDELSGLVVVIEDSRLSKDVSQAKIVEDEAFHRARMACVDARWQVIRALLDSRLGPHLEWLWRDLLMQYMITPAMLMRPVARELATLVTWPSGRGAEREISLVEIVEAVEARGQLSYALHRVGELPESEELTPVISDRDELAWLSRVFGPDKIVRIDLQREHARAAAERRFRSRRVRLEIGDHIPCIAKAELRGRFRGEVGLSFAPASNSFFSFIKEGCLLCVREVKLPVRGLVVVVEGDFKATESLDDIVLDRDFAIDIFELLAGAIDVLALAVAESEDGPTLDVVGLVKRNLVALLGEGSGMTILGRMGYHSAARGYARELRAHLMPRLGVGRCPGERPHALARSRLFRTVGGELRSLVEIGESLRAVGIIRHLQVGREEPSAETDPSVFLFGRGDRRIVSTVFGDAAMEQSGVRILSEARRADFMAKVVLDIDAELGYRTALSIPPRVSQGFANLLACSFDTGEGTVGYICLAPKRLDEPIPGLMDSVVTRLVIHGRDLCEFVFPLGIGPCRALAWDERMRPAPSWDAVVEDDALNAVGAAIAVALGDLLADLCYEYPRLPSGERYWARRILVHAAASAAQAGPVIVPSAIETLELLPRDGDFVSIEQLGAEVARDGTIEHIMVGTLAVPRGEKVLELDEQGLADLRALFGDESLVDATPRLMQGVLRDDLRGRPAAPANPSLPADEAVVVESMEADGARGVIGLARSPDQGLVIDLCTLGRHLGTFTIEGRPPLRAFFIDSKLPLVRAGLVDLECERVTQLARWCSRRVPSLIAAACEAWDTLDGPARAAAWVHMRPLFVDVKARAGRRTRVGWRALRAVPLFPAVDGRLWSVDELQPHTGAGRGVRWLAEALPGEYQGARPVLILDEEQRACLGGVFDLEDFTEGWARIQEIVDAAGAEGVAGAMSATAAPEGALISRKSLAAGGLDCHLWLPGEFNEGLGVDFAVDGWIFESGRPCPYLLCGGVITCKGAFTLAAVEERQLNSIHKQIAGLYESLCARLQSGRLSRRSRPVALRYLRWIAREMDRQVQGDLSRWQIRLRERLVATLPAWPGASVRPVERAGVFDRTGREEPAEPKGQATEATEATEAKQAKEREAEAEGPIVEVARPIYARIEAVATEDVAASKLLHGLVAQLRMARVSRAGLLSEINLSRLALRDFRGAEVARASNAGIEINGRHPLVALALSQVRERGGVEPMILGVLASAIYSVINWEAEDVTDDDERGFINELAGDLYAPLDG